MMRKSVLVLLLASLPAVAFSEEQIAPMPSQAVVPMPVDAARQPIAQPPRQNAVPMRQQPLPSMPPGQTSSGKKVANPGGQRGFSVDFDKGAENKRGALPDFSGEMPTIVLPEVDRKSVV